MSAPDAAGLLETSKELDLLRKKQEEVLQEINKLHKKLQSTPEVVEKPGDNSLSRLKMLYTQAKELAESEVNKLKWGLNSNLSIISVSCTPVELIMPVALVGCSFSTHLLGQLEVLIPPGPPGQQRRRIEGNEQKKKRMKADSDMPRLSPSMRHQEALANLKGEQVAARVTQENAEKDEWVIVKVIHFDRETKVIEVLDEEPGDDEEGGGQRKYKLPMSHIIPFPKRSDSTSAQDFGLGKQVLALYPGTTALYRATVAQQRKVRNRFIHVCYIQRKIDDYVLEFDDDEEEDGSLPQRLVPFHRVVGLPEGHKQ
ncbi:hypothetical protein RHGRI_028162 [Rhododendron griersonianum]|uniref:SGF29 C-terminal domain-containing protein n=1 Tax=Rhododendron griersonianum TaxID=479676 RepID=A0AAV6IH20_9ERIC|nr:hypothetical protein RHGRI_028162 [Rhododendron griersonianum]